MQTDIFTSPTLFHSPSKVRHLITRDEPEECSLLLASGRALRELPGKTNKPSGGRDRIGFDGCEKKSEAEPEISINLLFSSLLISDWHARVETQTGNVSWRRFSPTVIIGSGSLLASNANQVFNYRENYAKSIDHIDRNSFKKNLLMIHGSEFLVFATTRPAEKAASRKRNRSERPINLADLKC